MTNVAGSDAVKRLTEEWYRRVWNERSPGAIEELMADDAVIEGLEILPEGKEGFRNFRNAIVRVFDDLSVKLSTLIVEGNSSKGESIVTGLHKETGKPVHINVTYEAEWMDGQLIYGKNVVDYLALTEQTGVSDFGSTKPLIDTEEE